MITTAQLQGLADARFWSKIDDSAGPDLCWPWMGAQGAYGGIGKPIFSLTRSQRLVIKQRSTRPTRVVLAACGFNVDDLYACHHCDNPHCCNPYHLYAGTSKQNRADIDKRHRRRYFNYNKT
jgi:hypothetical protein